MSQKREVKCRVVDAEFNEEMLDVDDGESKHEMGIIMTLELLDTGEMVPSYLSELEVRALTGLQKPLGSMELIRFAHELEKRKEPMTLVIDPQEDMVTSEMIAIVPESVQESLAHAMREAVDEFDAATNLNAQLVALHRLHLLIENATQQLSASTDLAGDGSGMSARERVMNTLKKDKNVETSS